MPGSVINAGKEKHTVFCKFFYILLMRIIQEENKYELIYWENSGELYGKNFHG